MSQIRRTIRRPLQLLGPALPYLLALAMLPLGAPHAASAAQQTFGATAGAATSTGAAESSTPAADSSMPVATADPSTPVGADSSAAVATAATPVAAGSPGPLAADSSNPGGASDGAMAAAPPAPASSQPGVEAPSTMAPPPEAGAGPRTGPMAERTASPYAAASITAGMPLWKLLVVDARDVFTAPAHWTGREWGLFSLEVAAVVGIGTADRALQRHVLGANKTESDLSKTVRPLGTYASFGVLGSFYLGGLIAHDARAQETAVDGLIASGLAAGVITPLLKEIVGRSRPSAHVGTYDFHPFRGSASFPSGETTQAFAVASVISAQYPNAWVEVVSYGLAGLVGFARMRENAHFASDVLAGALIGHAVGRAVVNINNRLRARVTVAPLIGPHMQGLTIVSGF